MSEQNPGAQDGVADSSEPSMEEILASIRKIIADDESEDGLTETAVGDLELDVVEVDTELTSDLAQDDTGLSAPESSSVESSPMESVMDLIHDTDMSSEDVTDLQLDEIVEDVDLVAPSPKPASEPEALTVQEGDEDDLDLDSILSELVDDNTDATDQQEVEQVKAADVTPLDTDLQFDDSEDPDLVLVKSLMADLTEPASEDDTLLEDVLELTEEEAEDSNDLIDEILNGTLEQENEVAQAETEFEDLEIPPEPTVESEAGVEAVPTSDETSEPSLADIAAAAEQDAAQNASVIAMKARSEEPTQTTSIDAEINDPDQEEAAPMAKAAKKEKIVDSATEQATADVFASFNKTVEEKAVLAERGDRIGDLVMDALQPMLKEWLDKNLKGIVERAVTKEVKRISSGK